MAKPRKRANGDGSLYKRSSDGLWVGAVVLPDGKRVVRYGKDRPEAKGKLDKVIAALQDGEPVQPGREPTLGEFLQRWITEILAQRVDAEKMAVSTYARYASQVRLHIVPDLGKHPLRKLTPTHVRTWVGKKQGERTESGELRLTAKSVAMMHSVLRKALGDAMREELVSRNVALLVEAPSGTAKREPPLTAEEAKLLLAAAIDSPHRALWLFIMATGVRRGEALALRWEDVDLEAGHFAAGPTLLRVEGVALGPDGKRRGKAIRSKGKTKASEAILPLPAFMVQELRQLRTQQARMKLESRVWQDSGHVFVNTLGGPLDPRNVLRRWHALCEQAGVRRCRIHSLRHTAATWLFEAGVDIKVIQSMLRHKRLQTTSDTYTHVRDPLRMAAAEVMDGLLRAVQ